MAGLRSPGPGHRERGERDSAEVADGKTGSPETVIMFNGYALDATDGRYFLRLR
jgi:hypothetical protein